MNTIKTALMVIFVIFTLVGSSIVLTNEIYIKDTRKEIDSIKLELVIYKQKVDYMEDYLVHYLPDSSLFNKEWFLFKLALIDVESNHVPDAVNPNTSASGILQIMPVYIKEANRLSNDTVFTDDDVFDVDKSILMFETINKARNPDKCMDKAILLHNPTVKGDWYKNLVYQKYQYYLSIAAQL